MFIKLNGGHLLCDIIEEYINIYLRLCTTIFHNSE